MGCVQTNGMQYTPPQSLEKRRIENGYCKGGSGGQSNGQNVTEKDDLRGGDQKNIGGTRKIFKEGEEGNNNGVGNVLQRIVVKKIGSGELVDGWPKWLVDNMPNEVLATLVPKSADAYDELAKFTIGGLLEKTEASNEFLTTITIKPNFYKAVGSLSDSAMALLPTLLSLEPVYRGTAASALQNEFFTSSPLACELGDDDVLSRPTHRKKRVKKRQHPSVIYNYRSRRVKKRQQPPRIQDHERKDSGTDDTQDEEFPPLDGIYYRNCQPY